MYLTNSCHLYVLYNHESKTYIAEKWYETNKLEKARFYKRLSDIKQSCSKGEISNDWVITKVYIWHQK